MPETGKENRSLYQKLRRSEIVFSDACSVTVHLHLNRTARFLSLPPPGKGARPGERLLRGRLCAEESLERLCEAVVHVERRVVLHRRGDEAEVQLRGDLVGAAVELLQLAPDDVAVVVDRRRDLTTRRKLKGKYLRS